MEKQKFICRAKGVEQFNSDGESAGIGNDRAFYYSPSIGKGRIYRDTYPLIKNKLNKGHKLFEYSSIEKAQAACNRINEAYYDVFEPLAV